MAGSPGGDQRTVQEHIVANSPCVTSWRCQNAEQLWCSVAERWKQGYQKPCACPVSGVFLEPHQHSHFTLARPQSPTQPMFSHAISARQSTLFPVYIPFFLSSLQTTLWLLLSLYPFARLRKPVFFPIFFFFNIERNSVDLYTLIVFLSYRLYCPRQKQSYCFRTEVFHGLISVLGSRAK